MIVLHGFLTRWPQARFATALGIAWIAAMLGACDRSGDADKAKQAAAAAPPPPAVVVTDVVQKTVPIYGEFVAQTDARETVEIRARVQAFLEAQHFTEGTIVKKDQLLFTLDKREFEAKLQQAKAELEVAQAGLGKAETDERRLKPLAERKAVPQQDYDNAAANLLAAQGERVGRPRQRRRGGAGPELYDDPLADRGPDRQTPGGSRQPRRQVRRDAVDDRVVHQSDPGQRDRQRGGIPALFRQTQGGRERCPVAGPDPRRRQRFSEQGQARHRRSGGGPEDRHAGVLHRVSEPRGAAAPRTVRSHSRSRRDGQGRDPDSEAGGPGDPGHADRARGRRRQHGRAAHDPARQRRSATC